VRSLGCVLEGGIGTLASPPSLLLISNHHEVSNSAPPSVLYRDTLPHHRPNAMRPSNHRLVSLETQAQTLFFPRKLIMLGILSEQWKADSHTSKVHFLLRALKLTFPSFWNVLPTDL
jgi:hypothetical protein